jgi:endonuclease YncB( thermonuclease family)
MVLLVAGHEDVRIRHAGVECPEREQAFGKKAKGTLLSHRRGMTVE